MLWIEAARRVGGNPKRHPGVPTMSDPRRGYVAYLLRLWQVSEGQNAVWRASLEGPHTGERRGFATLQELFTYLETEACGVGEDPSTSDLSGTGGSIADVG